MSSQNQQSQSTTIGESGYTSFSPTPTNRENNNDSKLMKTIQSIINTPTPTPNKSIFKFENNDKAAAFNSKLLRSMNMDFTKTIKAQKKSFLSIGSEFPSPDLLSTLFSKHIRWPKMKRILSKGVEYAFKKDILSSESTRTLDLKAAIKRGNNASAKIPENF